MHTRFALSILLGLNLIFTPLATPAAAGGVAKSSPISAPPVNRAPAPTGKRTQGGEAERRPKVSAGQAATLLPDGRWLITGGEGEKRPSASAVIRDASGKETILHDGLLRPRARHTATLLPDGNVLVYGGVGIDGKVTGDAELLDPHTGKSEAVAASGLSPRAEHTATLLTDGLVLIAGGVDEKGRAVSQVDLWDPRTRSAVMLPSGLKHGRRGHTASLLPDGNILLWGGRNSEGGALDDGEIYQTEGQSFSWTGVPSAGEDEAQPYVVYSSPKDGEGSVPRDVRVALRFSKPLRVETLTSETVTLIGPEGEVAVTVVPAESGMLGFVRPAGQLGVGASYTLSLKGATDNAGQPLAPLAFSFTTVQPEEQEHAPAHRHEGHAAHIEEQAAGAPDNESWEPNAKNPYGDWRSNRGESPWQKLAPMQAAPGVTALAGQVLRPTGQPLANVTLQIGDKATRTDSTGRFLLSDIPAGHQVMLLNGHTASNPGRLYAMCENGVEVVAGRTNVLPYTIWLPVIDTHHVTRIPVPTSSEVVVTSPLIPGLEVHIPPGVRLHTHHGDYLTEMSLTAVPADHSPVPLPPGALFFFTPQSHGAEIEVAGGDESAGFRVVYPNVAGLAPGTGVDLMGYDPERPGGWYVYGRGTVTKDGKQIAPNPGVVQKKLNCYGGFFDNDAPSTGPVPGAGATDGDPVDLGTGLFVYNKTDLVLPDTMPIEISRTYRPNDPAGRAFGVGSTFPYELTIVGDNGSLSPSFGELVLPDGGRIRYERTNPGSSPFAFEHTATPTIFYKSTMVSVSRGQYGGWDIRLRNGTTLQFIKIWQGIGVHEADIRLVGIVDRFGNALSIQRDANQHITRIVSPNGRWVEFTYDPARDTRIIQAKDNTGRTVGYVYDAGGRLWKVTDTGGGITEYAYDAAGRMLTVKDQKGVVRLTNEYDANGRVSKQTQADGTVYLFAYTLDGTGRVTQTDVTNPRGLVRRVAFNAAGYPLNEVYGVGRADQWSFTYERQAGTNLVLSVTDSWGRKVTYGYDPDGHMNAVTRLAGTPQAVTSTATFDPVYGNVLSVTDPLNHTSTFDYDSLGRLTGATDPLNHHVSYTYNGAGQLLTTTNELNITTSRFTYEGGDLIKGEGLYGHTVRLFVDAAGRTAGVTDPLGQTTRYEYNALNRATRATNPQGVSSSVTYNEVGNLLSTTDGRGNTVSYSYDSIGRPTGRTDQLLHSDTYHYDAYGNVDSATDRKGQVTNFSYDVFNRLTQVTYADSSTVAYSYDARGRLEQVTDSISGAITYAYDDFDRVTSETTPRGSVSYAYDAAGRAVSMQVAGQATVIYTYDAANRLTQITQGSASVSIGYDAAGRRTSLTLPNGLVTEYVYDDASQLTSLTYRQGGVAIGDLTFGYDAAGRRTKMGGSYARLVQPQAVASASYDAANRQTTFGGRALTYDLNGNLTGDGINTYTWDARDQLVGITGPGVSASFVYDAGGRRVGRTVNGQTTGYLYDGANAVQEQSGAAVTANLLNGGVDEVFQRTDAAGVWTPLGDALGSTLALTDGNGTVRTSFSYGAFGETARAGAATEHSGQYAGRENDGTGLYFNRARYYSPALQRFISEDPAGLAGGDNAYAYVSNNPVGFTDPSGLTQAGAVNYLRDPFAPENWVGNGAANTLSDLLMLDNFAEWSWTVGDYCRPASERVWAGAKGVGTAAFLAFGGEVAGKIGGKLLGALGRTGVAEEAAYTGIQVTGKGLDRVAGHLARFGEDAPNAAMLGRLKSGLRSPQDINFYLHELKESAIMARGVADREAHLLTLEWQGIAYKAGYEARLYHPDVIRAFSSMFNPAAWP